ncbi:formate dehydrogenase subunit gamma [Oleisolibacter albus]|uniref:formate dehydrogenase subunit gamma n=1 Tax=Oleisolibacter albus TaxID=2171757 RepID=UPI000DF13C79|nr:formate dehydrogenase subunit gamma [Oleisolibacter albus]
MTAQRLRIVLTAALLLMALPALAQQTAQPHAGEKTTSEVPTGLYQIPGQTEVTSPDEVPLFVPAQDKIIGRVSIPDGKLATLVQPEGRVWRDFRQVWLKWGAGIIILGAAAALTLFYLLKGTLRIEHGRSGRWVPRFTTLDRFAHWTTAVSFLTLALTGLLVTFGRPILVPLFGHEVLTPLAQAGKILHNFTSVPFVLGLVLMAVLWIRDNIPERADWIWIKTGGGILRKVSEHPEAGRFNAGQKLVFWGVLSGGGALAISGFLMMVPFAFTGVTGMQWIHVIHAVVAAFMIAMILGHIYIGTLGMEGAFDAMGRGEVDENWAIEHHRGWYNEMFRRQREPPAGSGHPAGAE